MRARGSGGTAEVPEPAAAAFVAQTTAEHGAGHLALEDDDGRTLFLYWSSGRLFAMTMSPGDDVSQVVVEHADGTGPDVEITLENGQVDTWPWEATVPVARAAAVAVGWARSELPPDLTWTADPPTR